LDDPLAESKALSPPRPLHVLTLTPFYPTASDEARGCFVSEPLSLLQALGIENTILAVQSFYNAAVSPSEKAPPAHWIRYLPLPSGIGLPTAGVFLYANILRAVRELVRRKPIDVMHAHSALPCGHAAALLSRELGIPFVVTVHGLDAFSTNQVRGLAGKWAKRISQWVYRKATNVICVSEKVRAEVLQAAPVNTSVIYNGVDPDVFSPGAESGKVILSVGNLIPTKGHELLLKALAALQDQHGEATCDIIGDGPERSRLTSLCEELKISGKVRFLGRQSRARVAEGMQHCSIFALPSSYEALGCVYLEAMSAEKPVVGCREQGIEEIIQHGINGLLIGPEGLSELTRAISMLLDDETLRRRMGRSARHTIKHGFTLKDQAERLAALYRECAA
jgi:teichuronic acid biosynthesis glycosyltransferase TuaC